MTPFEIYQRIRPTLLRPPVTHARGLGLLVIPDTLEFHAPTVLPANHSTALVPHTHDTGLLDAVDDLLGYPPPDITSVDCKLPLPNSPDTQGFRPSFLDIVNPFVMSVYLYLHYGTVNPLALKTKVISTSDANADPVFQAKPVAESNGFLEKGLFQVFPRSRVEGYHIYISKFVDEIKVWCTSCPRQKSFCLMQTRRPGPRLNNGRADCTALIVPYSSVCKQSEANQKDRFQGHYSGVCPIPH